MYIPTVSICIPAYKQVDYLRKTLCSIQDQTYTDYEIVITDDSPNDDVKNLVQEFNFENKLKYYKNRKQLGSPRNWNEAVSKSGGKYIKILHHDDWFTFPYSLEEYVALLDNNKEVDFAFSAAVGFNVKEDHKWIHSATEKQLEQLKENPEVLFFGNFIGPPSSTIYRKSIGLKYDTKLKWVVDFDFYIRALKKNKCFAFCSKELITSVSGGHHNVTNECANNKDIELFEFLHLFNKINLNKLNVQRNYIGFFTALFKKYNVTLCNILNKTPLYLLPLPIYLLAIKNQKTL